MEKKEEVELLKELIAARKLVLEYLNMQIGIFQIFHSDTSDQEKLCEIAKLLSK